MERKKSQVVTSLRVDPDLWREAKIEAIRRGTSLASLIDEAIRKEIGKDKDEAVGQDGSQVHKT